MEILRELNLLSVVVRIALSLLVGGVLGLERGRRNRPAGFRTYMLVCLGAALVMMTNQYVFLRYGVGDPVRMGAQVISGIGFLGAGTIILTGKSQVKGITTAAGLWTAACCGLAIGIGFYEGAIAGGLTIIMVMTLFQKMDMNNRARARSLDLYLEMDNATHFATFIEYVRQHGIEVSELQIQKNKMLPEGYTSVVLTADWREKRLHSDVIELLSEAPGVRYVQELL